MFNSILRVSVLLLVLLIAAPGALAQAWPEVFNPFQILTLKLSIELTHGSDAHDSRRNYFMVTRPPQAKP